jgi:hypothetical protein
MANITEILGTDPISGSRTTINSNFTAINDEVADITALIDPITSTITGIDSISAQQLTLSTVVNSLTTQLLQVDSSGAIVGVDSVFNKNVEMSQAVQKNGYLGTPSGGSVDTNPNFSAISTLLTAAASISLPVGTDGQEVTIISKNSSGTSIATTNAAATSIDVPQNASVTLKYFSDDATWYIIAEYNATIS